MWTIFQMVQTILTNAQRLHGWSNSSVVILAFRNTKILIRRKRKEGLVSLRLFPLLRDHDPGWNFNKPTPRGFSHAGPLETRPRKGKLAPLASIFISAMGRREYSIPCRTDRDTEFILITFPHCSVKPSRFSRHSTPELSARMSDLWSKRKQLLVKMWNWKVTFAVKYGFCSRDTTDWNLDFFFLSLETKCELYSMKIWNIKTKSDIRVRISPCREIFIYFLNVNSFVAIFCILN